MGLSNLPADRWIERHQEDLETANNQLPLPFVLVEGRQRNIRPKKAAFAPVPHLPKSLFPSPARPGRRPHDELTPPDLQLQLFAQSGLLDNDPRDGIPREFPIR